MAGRPPTPVGTHGAIKTREVAPKVYEARTYHCDLDGVLRDVRRRGPSKSAAEANLKKALRDRNHRPGAEVTGDMRVRDLGARWFEQMASFVEAGDRAPNTPRTYGSVWRNHVEPALGALRVREATTERCERWLVELRKHQSAATCSTARSALSGVLGYAARMGAIPTNPVRDLSMIPGSTKRKRKPRAMTPDEIADWLHWLDNNVAHEPGRKRHRHVNQWPTAEVVASRALGDITRFMLATGVRIGEAMAVSWDEVDFDAGTVRICWHIVRVKGEGLVRMDGTKSEGGDRLLRLPGWALDMLRRRADSPDASYPVFPDVNGAWRDPVLISRWLRWSREEAGFAWITSHVFRQTVIKVLDQAGLSTSEVADQAGHARISQTQDYMQRGIASPRAAEVLDGLLADAARGIRPIDAGPEAPAGGAADTSGISRS